MEYFLSAIVLLSALVQGGFYPSVFLLCGITLAIFCVMRQKVRITCPELVLWILSIVYIAASLIAGYSASSLAQACLPGVCACFLRCWLTLPAVKHDRLIGLVILGTGIFAWIGILALCGIVDITGAVASHRLQFPFQYANAAGSWFAAIVLLIWGRPNQKEHAVLLPVLVALFLTRSVGALGLYAVFHAIQIYKKRKEPVFWKETVLIHIASALFSVSFYFISGPLALVLLAALYVMGWFWPSILHTAQRIHLHWIGLAFGIAGVSTILFSQRFSASLGTFIERLVQIRDGTVILLEHPLLGIGAGEWAYAYPYYQSTQYTSSVVHSSLVQIGVDAGIFAIILASIFCVLAWRQRSRSSAINLSAALLLLHSVVDFTLMFFPICALVLILLFYGVEPDQVDRRKTAVPSCVICVLIAILFSGVFHVEQEHKSLIHTAKLGDPKAVIALYEDKHMLFGKDHEAQNLYLNALYYTGQYEIVLEETSGTDTFSESQEVLWRAQALAQMGDYDAACELLLSELEQKHFRVELFVQVAQLLTEWEADCAYLDAYDQIVDRANGGQTILGTLKGDQVYINHIQR